MAHFYASIPETIRALTDSQAVDRYIEGAEVPGRAIAGLNREQLLARPIAGTWSIQEIVVHLMDSDLISAYRMKRIIAEDRPTLDVWDENAFAARLGYDKIAATQATELFRLNRLVMGRVLRALPSAAFERVALHPEIGELPLGALLRLYVHHLDHHMAFLQKKRAMLSGMEQGR